jgi:uncharacterized protein YndB with AHSA1/START domain
MKVEITKAPVAETEMLVRKPVAEVFEAFVDPWITTQFWSAIRPNGSPGRSPSSRRTSSTASG